VHPFRVGSLTFDHTCLFYMDSRGKNQYKLNIFFSIYLQGSAKLEKAEILQMTVDHLKMLHASGGKGNILFIHLK